MGRRYTRIARITLILALWGEEFFFILFLVYDCIELFHLLMNANASASKLFLIRVIRAIRVSKERNPIAAGNQFATIILKWIRLRINDCLLSYSYLCHSRNSCLRRRRRNACLLNFDSWLADLQYSEIVSRPSHNLEWWRVKLDKVYMKFNLWISSEAVLWRN